MEKINYKELCAKLNVTDATIKDMIKEYQRPPFGCYFSEKYNYEWIEKVVNPGCKLTATEIFKICKSLKWAKPNEYPKFFMLHLIACMLFSYRVEELSETFSR